VGGDRDPYPVATPIPTRRTNMRKLVEQHFEANTGGRHLVPWMFEQKQSGKSLRDIAEMVRVQTGIQISHVSVANWMRTG